MNATQKYAAAAAMVFCGVVASVGLAADPALDTGKIEQVIGAKGQMNAEEGMFKVSIPAQA